MRSGMIPGNLRRLCCGLVSALQAATTLAPSSAGIAAVRHERLQVTTISDPITSKPQTFIESEGL